jgi:hypothetical protein
VLQPQARQSAQRSAIDPKQIKLARRLANRQQIRLEAALKSVMNTADGRLVMWELLRTCGIFSSVWEASAKIHYNAGRQDVGHEILSDLHLVSTDLYLLMEREMRALAAREQAEIDASHTSGADEGDANG